MESPAVVKALLPWFHLLVEGSLWILLVCLLTVVARTIKASTKVWILRFAFAKFWVSAVVFAVFGIFLAPEVPAGESTATLVQSGQVFFLVTAALIILGPAYVLVQYLRINSILKRLATSGSPIAGDGLSECSEIAEKVGAWHIPRVVVSNQVDSPALVGLWRQAIVLPERYSLEEGTGDRQQVLAHELAHVMRRDPLWSVLPLLTLASMPWNPVLYWAVRLYRLFTEQAADDTALQVLDGKKSDYAGLLARSATGQTSLTAGLAFGRTHVSDLKQRLVNIGRFSNNNGKLGWMAAAPIALTLILQPVTPEFIGRTTAEFDRKSKGLPRFEVIVLPRNAELGPSTAWDVNEKGEVALNYNWRSPFIWSEEEGLKQIQTTRFDSQVNGVNNDGLAVGGNIRRIGVFGGGDDYSEITGLNGHAWDVSEEGHVVGRFDGDVPTAFRFHPSTGLELLEASVLGDLPHTYASAVNSSGTTIGTFSDNYFNASKNLAWIWEPDGTIRMLPMLEGSDSMSVSEISDDGVIVGNSWKDGRHLPTTWFGADQVVLNDQPNLFANSWQFALNSKGYSVGSGWNSDAKERTALIWTPDRRVMDLNDLCDVPEGLWLTFARGISDNMYIACDATDGEEEVAVLLKPIFPR
ncbi:MAG: hypothetical protein IH944_13780 [Armatimonadetes bacterium]|nr:hypothetical protein [Armatimonadota bacterium]